MAFYALMALSFFGALLKVMWEFVLTISSILVVVAAVFFCNAFDVQLQKRSGGELRLSSLHDQQSIAKEKSAALN